MVTEELSNLPGGRVQIILRSEFKHEVAERMERFNKQAAGPIQWLGPMQTSSLTWTAIGRGPLYILPVEASCSDDQGEFGIENAPEVYGDPSRSNR